ncbi:hypothetical protein KKB10_05925 [Patescibacteria group bacterium]|nr:hypothetical protein [Patescibacteria group bacterium]MBU1075370.1 hypothetical protein [Patescibacteria group bacterium]MBU1951886.1 hypothetical protein [Patescibacteria group bacterium]
MNNVFRSLKEVFKKPSYIILATAISFVIYVISIWLPSKDLLRLVFDSELFNFGERIKFLWSMFGLIKTNFSITSGTLVVILSLLGGVNMTLFVFYFKRRVKLQKSAGISVLGIIIGFLGIGCASCGSIVLSSFIGFSAAASFIGILPFNGLEFAITGVIVLIISIYLIGSKIQNPLLCRIEKTSPL